MRRFYQILSVDPRTSDERRSRTVLAARKALSVDDSLSIVVPVRDAQAVIWNQLHYLLDLIPDLTSRFEIIIVDDASHDHTPEIVSDLARRYPQIRLITNKTRQGLFAATKAGLAAAMGNTVFVQEDMAAVSAAHLRRLWSLRNDTSIVIARAEENSSGLSPELIERLSTWGQSLRNQRKRVLPGGIQMIRRDGAQSLAINGMLPTAATVVNQ